MQYALDGQSIGDRDQKTQTRRPRHPCWVYQLWAVNLKKVDALKLVALSPKIINNERKI